jgi:hypothetical protein
VCVLCCVGEEEGTCAVYFALFFILMVLISLEFDNIFSFFFVDQLYFLFLPLLCAMLSFVCQFAISGLCVFRIKNRK